MISFIAFPSIVLTPDMAKLEPIDNPGPFARLALFLTRSLNRLGVSLWISSTTPESRVLSVF